MPLFYSEELKAQKRLELKRLFPEIFSDGEIDYKMLQASMGDGVDEKEHYRFEWSGKRDCYQTIQTPSSATLRTMDGEKAYLDDAQNAIIEGDNLEVLKLLQKSYRGRIKMIYIDPPYNKAKDFVYSDSWSDPVANYLIQTEQMDNEGYLSTRTESTGRRHTNWLNMIYPRLYLARNLLKEDGVIFVSIDDDEVANLRKIMDDIFGEENFFAQVIIQANKRGQTYKQISKTHEYLLIYTKNIYVEINELEKDANNNDLNLEDDISAFNIRELRNRNPKFGKHNRPNLFYPFYVCPEEDDGFNKVSL